MVAGKCFALGSWLGRISVAFCLLAVVEGIVAHEAQVVSQGQNIGQRQIISQALLQHGASGLGQSNTTISVSNATEVAAELTAEEIAAKLEEARAREEAFKAETASLETALAVRQEVEAAAERMAAAMRANGTDLGGIMRRFALIDGKIQGLKAQFLNLNTVILQVKAEANATGVSLAHSEATLADAQQLAETNKVKAAALSQQYEGTAAMIDGAKAKMNGLQAAITDVEQTALTLGNAASNVGTKVGDLELAVKELLPGKEFLPSRIQRAQQHLTTYQSSIDSGSLDAVVASTIRANFLRAQQSTEQFTEQTLQRQLAADD